MAAGDVYTFLTPLLARVEERIDKSLCSGIDLLDRTNRSLRDNPGKMLRPKLSLLVAGACGQVNDDSIRFAAAAELLHNSTLLHDDVVDGASQRRGLPTVASLLGAQASVLIGDYWLVKCLENLLDAERFVNRVISIFSSTLSSLAEGEMLQMQKASSGDTSEGDYLRIVYSKTASLFEAAALSAAISVNAPEEWTKAAGEYAKSLGIAFQIKDDILDYSPEVGEIGKPVGIDLKEQKITQPLLCALDEVSPEEEAAIRKKITLISDNPAFQDEVLAFVMEHDGMGKAKLVMDSYINRAVSCLDVLPDGPRKGDLARLAEFVGDRNK